MGLCKVCLDKCPSEDDLEVVATRAFSFVDPDVSKNGVSTDAVVSPLSKIRILDAIEFCLSDPETVSWLEYFENLTKEMEMRN